MRLCYFGNKYWFHWFSNMFLPDGFKTQDLWKVYGFFANFFKCVFLVADVVFGCWKKKHRILFSL